MTAPRAVKSALIVFACWLFLGGTACAWETLDKIVAIVGDKVITASELDFQLQLYSVQTGKKLTDRDEAAGIRQQILRQMIDDRLILAKAKQDTTIKVTDDEVESGLNERLDELRQRFPSDAEFTRQLEVEGYSLRDLKAKLREDARDQIYKEKLIGNQLRDISVTRTDVEGFFKTYRDSLPGHPKMIKMAHLLLRLGQTGAASDSLRQLAQSLVDRINRGESFEELARQYSQDAAAETGGDIGTFRRGDLMPEFERGAMALPVGAISGVVETPLGFHVIKLLSKSEDQFHAKHIILLNEPTTLDSGRVFAQAELLLDSMRRGADFGMLVKELSADSTTRTNFGELGWLPLANLPLEFAGALGEAKAGEFAGPVWSPDGLHILKVLELRDERPFSLQEDFDLLKDYARRQKSQQVVAAIVNEMKDKVYLDLRN